MATIDKTYISKEEYIQVRKWWLKTRKKQINDLGDVIWMYPFGDFKEDENIDNSTKDIDMFKDGNCVWNTSIKQDIWLAKNCPLPFIQQWCKIHLGETLYSLKDEFILTKQYNDIRIVRIEGFDDKLVMHFFKDNEEESLLYLFDKIIVYGTTYVYEVLHEAIRIIQGFESKSSKISSMSFTLFGLLCGYEDGKFQTYKNNGELVEFDMFYIDRTNIKFPKIKHSFNIKDISKYKNEEIFLSTKDEVFSVDCFDKFDRERLSSYFAHLPTYVNTFIKE